MSAEPGAVGPPADVGLCPLCGQPVDPAGERCDGCGMTLAGRRGRPAAFSRAAFWWAAGGLLVIYLVVLGVVAVVH